jgi:ribonuclease P protein component
VIWRIRERAAFERLRVQGVRIRPLTPSLSVGEPHRRRSLWCSYLPDVTDAPPRVAFAIGRKVGPAVVRNRLRRQIRAVLIELQQGQAGQAGHGLPVLPGGSYLFGAHPSITELSFAQLRSEVIDLMAGAHRIAETRIPSGSTS